jgi:hypothetical protein
MKKRTIAAIAALGTFLAFPAAAHHNCAAGDACPDEIGDVMGNHESVFSGEGIDSEGTETNMGGMDSTDPSMDPADDAAPANRMDDSRP